VEGGVSAAVLGREARARRAARWERPRRARDERLARLRVFLGRAAVAVAVAASLAAVVWRQTEGADRQRELSRLREEVSVLLAERTDGENRVQALQTRARVVRVARERLGLHVARDDEVVLLPIAAPPSDPEP
jgi:cell division protein FtsL